VRLQQRRAPPRLGPPHRDHHRRRDPLLLDQVQHQRDGGEAGVDPVVDARPRGVLGERGEVQDGRSVEELQRGREPPDGVRPVQGIQRAEECRVQGPVGRFLRPTQPVRPHVVRRRDPFRVKGDAQPLHDGVQAPHLVAEGGRPGDERVDDVESDTRVGHNPDDVVRVERRGERRQREANGRHLLEVDVPVALGAGKNTPHRGRGVGDAAPPKVLRVGMEGVGGGARPKRAAVTGAAKVGPPAHVTHRLVG